MKRAQGLPLTTIVIAVISFVVLFIVIIFFTGGFGKIFGQAKAAIGSVEADVSAAQTKCSQWCLQAQNLDSAAQKKSAWCTRVQGIDTDGDGKLNDKGTDETISCTYTNDGDEKLCCDQSPILSSCPGVAC